MSASIDWFIVGLGNPGRKYALNRHNIGWMVAVELCNKYKKQLQKTNNLLFSTNFSAFGKNVLVSLPITYMNNSGEAVRFMKEKYDIPIENICIILDEYNFPIGKIHLRASGSDGGHNGMASIIEELQSESILRLRCGIDRKFSEGGLVNYVLSDFENDEIEARNNMINKAVESLEHLIRVDLSRAMSDINSGKLWNPEEKDKNSDE